MAVEEARVLLCIVSTIYIKMDFNIIIIISKNALSNCMKINIIFLTQEKLKIKNHFKRGILPHSHTWKEYLF